jgi:3'-phosphoadenosine 5'-phosphosulfate sulfotransferase (PAPS reductase)/FAD synthetase
VTEPRIVCWFSAGAPSAVTAKLAVTTYGHDRVEIAYTDPGSEHPDNARFIDDCEIWFDHPVHRLHSPKYKDVWDVWEREKYLVGPTGARCTIEMKKKLRYAFQRPDDIQMFGFTVEEQRRVDRFREQNPGVTLECPLVDRGLTKGDCLAIIDRAGIPIPEMYKLGYNFNNCIGCPKGGITYWNKIRVDFPGTFDRMARVEREIGHSVLHDKNGAVWLDELDPERGRNMPMPDIECSLLCAIAEEDIANP